MAPLLARLGVGGGSGFGFGKRTVSSGPSGPFSATGGNLADGLAPGNGYKYHTFGSPGTFTVSGSPSAVEVLMVAGGGCGRGGGGAAGGGGGAGGLRYFSSIPVSSGTYSITVGGGSAAKGYDSPAHVGGTPTTAFSYTATGGGDAGSYAPVHDGQPGGSGGGGGSYPAGLAGAGTPGQGSAGGAGTTGGDPAFNGGGGGGAGGVGQPGSPGPLRSRGGNGLQYPQFIGPLIGVPSLNPLNGYFAGGGGGAIRVKTENPASPSDYVPGGLGGGGPAGTREPGTVTGGTSGTQYSGGGGGGDSAFTPPGSAGGPGIVIIRYLA